MKAFIQRLWPWSTIRTLKARNAFLEANNLNLCDEITSYKREITLLKTTIRTHEQDVSRVQQAESATKNHLRRLVTALAIKEGIK